MSFVTMRSDLQPLCPEHQIPMVACHLLLKIGANIESKPCYACEAPACTYHYDAVQGYFNTQAGERIERDMRYWQKCSREGLPMYISASEPQKKKRIWKCGQLGCAGGAITEGPMQKGTAASG